MATYIAERTVNLTGHIIYGTALVQVEAETEEEAEIKIAQDFDNGNYDFIDVGYEIDDYELEDDTTITKKEEN